jgi:hypothetical protein
MFASVFSNTVTEVQVKFDETKEVVRKTNKYQDQRKIKTVTELFLKI